MPIKKDPPTEGEVDNAGIGMERPEQKCQVEVEQALSFIREHQDEAIKVKLGVNITPPEEEPKANPEKFYVTLK